MALATDQGSAGGKSPLLWSMNWVAMIFMALPGLGMIIAGFLVNPGDLSDDGHPLNILLWAIGGFFLLVNAGILLVMTMINRKRTLLVTEGLDGTATILSVQETGTTVNDMPVMKLTLEIDDGYRPVRTVTHKETVPLSKLADLRPGAVIQVKVDRNRHDRIMLLY